MAKTYSLHFLFRWGWLLGITLSFRVAAQSTTPVPPAPADTLAPVGSSPLEKTAPAAVTPEAVPLSGTVYTDADDPLPGATLFLRGSFLGGITNGQGQFLFRIPARAYVPGRLLSVAYLGYETQEVPLPATPGTELDVVLASSLTPLMQVVSAASRVVERALQAPVGIAKVGRQQLAALPGPDLLRGLHQLPGVDVSAAGLLASSLSTRGFNAPTSERLVQLTDYFDTQAPSLSTNVGNLFGPSDLDVASVELLYGPASALYGANAFNGVLLFNTRDAFTDPGLSVRLRGGERGLLDGQLRYARKLGDRFAFKLVGGYLTARDYVAGDERAVDVVTVAINNPAGSGLGYDAVNRYGEVSNRFVPAQSPAFPGGVAPGLFGRTVIAPGFSERDLVGDDDPARSWKVQPALSYLLGAQVKATLSANITGSSTSFQSTNRSRLSNFDYRQYRAEVKGEQWFVRASTAEDNSGDSYNINFLGTFLQNAPSAVVVPGPPGSGGPQTLSYRDAYFVTYNSVYGQAVRNGAADAAAQQAAQQAANATQPRPGTEAFTTLRNAVVADATARRGARLALGSQLSEATAQYAPRLAAHTDLVVGGAYRDYRLGSGGTYFADQPGGDRLRNYEYGGYAQLTQTLLPEQRLKLTAAGRVDAFQNFAAVFSPRAAAVFSAGPKKEHNLRLSFGQAFRSPTQADQYNRLDIGSVLLLGNVGRGFSAYSTPPERFAQFTEGIFGDPNLLKPSESYYGPLRLERLTTFEGGYRGLVSERLFVEATYFRNFYRDFIGSYRIVGNTDGTRPTQRELQAGAQAQFQNPALPTRVLRIQANADQQVQTQGVTAAASYRVGAALSLNANYSFNELLNRDELPTTFQSFYNTPRHKYNAGLSGSLRRSALSYSVNYRWAEGHRYETPFASGELADYSAVDAYAAYLIAPLKTTVQLGANNLLDNANQSIYGGPNLSRLVYVGLQFDVR